MNADNVGGFVNLWLHRIFFFLILQDGDLPLISFLWRFIDIPLSPITQQSSKKRGCLGLSVICEDRGDDIAIGTTSRGDTYKIDLEDLERCKQHSWIKDPRGYFVSNIDHRVTPLHRFLLGTKGSKVMTDHINGDKSDNRKSNLRKCTQNQNSKNVKVKKNNKTGFPGVRQDKFGKWTVEIMVNRKKIFLGNFDSKFEAINVRRLAELEYFGEFAPIFSRVV